MNIRAKVALLGFVATSLLAVGCTDTVKVSETKAKEHVERFAALADEDVEQLRSGLPRGAEALAQGWKDDEQLRHPATLRERLDRVRDQERDLTVAKSTFFAVTDESGTVLRSDQVPDILAGKSLKESFPEIKSALEGEYVETFGVMAELQGSRNGPDEQWLAAAPLRDEEGNVHGAYVSGWSLERYAYRLEHALKSDLVREADDGGKIPLTYVFVFRGAKVYGTPITPSVNEEALEKLNLPAATANGANFHGQLEIEGRKFGFAAKQVPKLGKDAGVAMIRSEI